MRSFQHLVAADLLPKQGRIVGEIGHLGYGDHCQSLCSDKYRDRVVAHLGQQHENLDLRNKMTRRDFQHLMAGNVDVLGLNGADRIA